MNILIFLAAVAIGLSFSIGMAADRYGPRVAERFLERGADYAADTLKDWVNKNSRAACGYAFPVLFPLDLMFMIFLGAFLGLGSITSADAVDWLRKWSWLFAIAPALYVATDLIEDVLLARFLLMAETISESSVAFAKAITKAKFGTCTFAILQTICVSAIAAMSSREAL
jgi:hypothetical protein